MNEVTNQDILNELKNLRDDAAKRDLYFTEHSSDVLGQVFHIYSIDTNADATTKRIVLDRDFPFNRATQLVVISAGGATAGDISLLINSMQADPLDLYAAVSRNLNIQMEIRNLFYTVTNKHAGTAYIMIIG